MRTLTRTLAIALLGASVAGCYVEETAEVERERDIYGREQVEVERDRDYALRTPRVRDVKPVTVPDIDVGSRPVEVQMPEVRIDENDPGTTIDLDVEREREVEPR